MWLVKEPPPPSQFPCLPLTVCFCLKTLCLKYTSSVEKRMCGPYSSNLLSYHSSPFVFCTMMGKTLPGQGLCPILQPLSPQPRVESTVQSGYIWGKVQTLFWLTFSPLRDNITLGTVWWFGVVFRIHREIGIKIFKAVTTMFLFGIRISVHNMNTAQRCKMQHDKRKWEIRCGVL